MERLTEEELGTLEGLLAKLRTGDWCVDNYIVRPGDTPDRWHVFEAGEDDPPLLSSDFGGEDAARVAACARNCLPHLLAEVRRARQLEACVKTAQEASLKAVCHCANSTCPFVEDAAALRRAQTELQKFLEENP